MSQSPPDNRDVIDVRRRALGITEQQLSDAAGMPRSTLRTKIRDINRMKVSEVKQLAEALGYNDYLALLDDAGSGKAAA